MYRFLVLSAVLLSAGLPTELAAKPFTPGQYQIGNPVVQEICLKADGTWYGTTFNFGGQWIIHPPGGFDAAIFGNYRIESHAKKGFANDTVTIGQLKRGQPIQADWYDWFDDGSFMNILGGQAVIFLKSACDLPFKGENTHAATQ